MVIEQGHSEHDHFLGYQICLDHKTAVLVSEQRVVLIFGRIEDLNFVDSRRTYFINNSGEVSVFEGIDGDLCA